MMNSIIFGGVNSADYGIYISDEGVFNAPKRAVEIVTVPGRNGDIVIDQGHWENIKVTYPAFNHEDDLDTFAARLSAFRNALASQVGYQRLTDSFHPDEYRMALFVDGLDVDPVKYTTVGKFNLEFNCKPQRWLTSGEVAVSVSSGDTLTNPTQYESSPLLAVKGYGTIGFNGYEVELDNSTSMHFTIKNGQSNINVSGNSYSITFTESILSVGDTITLEPSDIFWKPKFTSSGYILGNWHIDSHSGIEGSTARARSGGIIIEIPDLSFAKGTASSYSTTTEFFGTRSESGGGGSVTAEYVLGIAYDGDNKITFTFTDTYSQTWTVRDHITIYDLGDITGEATQPLLGDPTYIDCDLGDAYKIYDGAYLLLNSNVALGSDLPKLASGSNTVTFDDTVTELKITPRWWKL